MTSVQITNMLFSIEHALLIFFVIGYFLTRSMFKRLVSFLRTRRTTFATASVMRERSVALLPQQANLHYGELSLAKADSFTIPLCLLPEDLCAQVACLCGVQGVGALSACCRKLQVQVWESREVWMSLSASAGLNARFARAASAHDACEVFRRAAFRTDLENLRRLATANRPLPILEEAAHVACGLLPGDLSPSDLADFIRIGSRCLEAHDPESPVANQAAQRLLRASRRCMELFTAEQLEHLEYAYKAVHQLHALMISSMQDSYQGLLQQSMCAGPPDAVLADSHDFKELLDLCNN